MAYLIDPNNGQPESLNLMPFNHPAEDLSSHLATVLSAAGSSQAEAATVAEKIGYGQDRQVPASRRCRSQVIPKDQPAHNAPCKAFISMTQHGARSTPQGAKSTLNYQATDKQRQVTGRPKNG
jgi:hypothetical protein